MKLLGRGWQYSAYDLGNGRVFKKRNTRIVAYWCMFKTSWYLYPQDIWKFPRYYKNSEKNIRHSFAKIRESSMDRALLGNPTIPEHGFDYEQDKIESVAKYLKRHSVADGKKIIDRFVVFVRFLIEKQLMDKSFNLGGNFGVRDEGSLVMTDIGELYSDPAHIQREIDRRVWEQPYILNTIPKGELRNYFVHTMHTAFSKHDEI